MADNLAWQWDEETAELPFDGSAAKSPRMVAAPKIEPQKIEQPKKVQPKVEQPKENELSKEEKQLKQISSLLIGAAVGFAFVGMMLIIGMYANNYSKERQVRILNAQLEDEKELTASMQTQASRVLAEADVYNRALKELQMKKATSGDIIVITVRETSETISYLTEEEPKRAVTYHGFN